MRGLGNLRDEIYADNLQALNPPLIKKKKKQIIDHVCKAQFSLF